LMSSEEGRSRAGGHDDSVEDSEEHAKEDPTLTRSSQEEKIQEYREMIDLVVVRETEGDAVGAVNAGDAAEAREIANRASTVIANPDMKREKMDQPSHLTVQRSRLNVSVVAVARVNDHVAIVAARATVAGGVDPAIANVADLVTDATMTEWSR